MAYELIETIELTGSAASIEFTSIPQDGTDLLCVVSSRCDQSVRRFLYIELNSDTGSNYAWVYLQGDGSSVTTNNDASTDKFFAGAVPGGNATANTLGNAQIYISNYTSTSSKSLSSDSVTENNATEAFQHISAGLYTTSSAITSVKVYSSAGSLVQYSSASLYKIY